MIDLPPPQYNYVYAGPTTTWVVTLEQVGKICRDAGGVSNGDIYGCQFMVGDHCYIVLPIVGIGGVSQRTRAMLDQHEMAHCNGWRHGKNGTE